jgi:hypothetical protein
MPRTYKKDYADPHEHLKAELALLLATALASKRKLILEYAAEHGTEGLLDYADSILDSGWDAHFDAAAAILAAAAVDSSIDTLDASETDYSDEFVSNLEKHHDLLAKTQAASLLGLVYDHTRDVALPTLAGWSIGQTLLDQLGKVLEQADKHEWPSEKLDTALEDMSAFSADKAAAMAHNALTFVSGASARSTASATGAHMKRSMSEGDDKVCPDCAQDEEDGWIGVNEAFSGSETEDVPHHPNCRCSVEYQWLEVPLEEAA